jgi:glucoamylase
VAVTFNELKTTTYGQNIKIVGSIAQLGSWDASKAIALAATQYTSSNPLWSTTITFAAGTTFQYKYILVNADGSVVWEADPNHSYTVPTGSSQTATKSDSWQ